MNYTGFNTSTLGYKLVSNQLRSRRVHSEQLNKYTAGLFDADGWVGFEFNKYGVYLRAGIYQAATVDTDFQMIRSLQAFYGIGRLNYSYQENGVSGITWRMSNKEAKIFFNRIGKHLRIKATHFRNLILLQEEGQHLDPDVLRGISEVSRKNSKWLKHPKHLSWAWVAGYLDGDGCYRYRQRKQSVSLCIKAASQDAHILQQLKRDFKGSILDHGSSEIWRRGLGKGHIKFSLPFLKNMRKYSCNINKYRQICRMIDYLESTQVAKTKRIRSEEDKR